MAQDYRVDRPERPARAVRPTVDAPSRIDRLSGAPNLFYRVDRTPATPNDTDDATETRRES